MPNLPASCDRCRLRRVKCDRQQPCTNCRRRDLACVVSTTTARPRGRGGGRKSKKATKLQDRVARLEALVNAVSASVQAFPGAPIQSASGEDCKSNDALIAMDSKLYQYAAGPIWSQLSSQIEGLREVLLDSSDDDVSSTRDSQPSMSSQQRSNQDHYQNMLLCNSSRLVVFDLDSIQHPPPAIRERLLMIYERNVDPLCKVFHKPTLRSYIVNVKASMQPSPEEAEVHAALFAMYGAAIVSMSDSEFDLLLESPRNVTLRRFCFAIEFYLTKADYLESRRLGPLQALVIYLLIIRFLEPGQKHWILIGLAVQVARGLGLHSAKSIQNFPPLQQELRCRLWHTLRILDLRAAIDRGTECVIGQDSFDTQLPQNLNDADLFEGQLKLPGPQEGITDMSFGLVVYDGITLMTELHHVKPTHFDPSNPSGVWVHRQKAASDLEIRLKERFTKFCDASIPLHWMLNYVIDVMVTFCRLLAVRPMSYTKDTGIPPPPADTQSILKHSISSLQDEERYFSSEAARGFTWFYWVHWYVLAVALVEIVASPSALLEESVWTVVSTAYDRQSHLVADTSTGSLWKPLKKLMSKVQLLRQSTVSSKATDEAGSNRLGIDTDGALAPVPESPDSHVENREAASWVSDICQRPSGAQLTQSESAYEDTSTFDLVDPFIHWDAFLDGMNGTDPFTHWTAP